MAYSIDDINKISSTRKAVQYQIYSDNKGNNYVGTSEVTLVFSPRADGVIYGGITVQSALDSLSNQITEVGGDSATTEELSDSERRLKCFAVVMASVL